MRRDQSPITLALREFLKKCVELGVDYPELDRDGKLQSCSGRELRLYLLDRRSLDDSHVQQNRQMRASDNPTPKTPWNEIEISMPPTRSSKSWLPPLGSGLVD